MRRLLPAVLREEPQFRLLFWGHALSMIGDRITFVALPFAVLSIGGGAGEVGIVIAATTLPFAAFSLLGGVWADRLPRHRVMLVSDLVRMVSQAVAAALLLSGSAEVWQLAALGVVFGTADAFFSPALTGLIPALVAPERLQEANALRALVMSSGMVSGPAIAGVLVAVLGPGGAIAVDAVTFAASAVALSRLRPVAAERLDAQEPRFLAQLAAGFREIRARRWVQGFLIVLFAYHVVVLPAIFVLGPVLAEKELGGVAAWAVITAAFGIGSIAGDLLILRFKPSRPLLWAGIGFTLASTQALIIGSGLPVAAIAALEAAAWRVEGLQAWTPPARAQATHTALCTLMQRLEASSGADSAGDIALVRGVYDEILRHRFDDADVRLNDLVQLEHIASGYPNRGAFLSALALEPPSATSDLAQGRDTDDDDALVISTIHSAKGKEWDAVFVIWAADGWIPSARATKDLQQVEEERRLFYVALTRAKRHLHVSYPLYAYASRWSADFALDQKSRFLDAQTTATMQRIHMASPAPDTPAPAPAITSTLDLRAALRSRFS